MSAAPEFVVKNYFYLQRISFKFHTLFLSHTGIFRVFCHFGYFLSLFKNFRLLTFYDFSYLQRISTARRPIAQASRNGDAPGREIVKIVHPLLDSENREKKMVDKGAFTYDVRCFLGIFDLPTLIRYLLPT